MATIISTLFTSLDGVAEVDPSWHFPYFDDNMGAAVTDDYSNVEVLLLGRVTYDSFAGAWPDREAAGGVDADYARQIGDTRKVVATRGDQDLGWRNAERTDDLLATVAALRADDTVGKVLIPGSLSVVRQLLAAGLLDELRLLIHPVAVGGGDSIFTAETGLQHLRVIATDAFPTGVIRVIYAPTETPAEVSYDEVNDKVNDKVAQTGE